MSENELETAKDETLDMTVAWQWGFGSAVANVVIVLFLGFWLGESVDMGLTVTMSIMVGLMNGGCMVQFFASWWHGRLQIHHYLGVAAIAPPVGYGASFLFGMMGATLSYSIALMTVGVPFGYAIMKYLASRPVAPEGHPDNILD